MQDTFARATHSAYAAGRPSAARDDRVSFIQGFIHPRSLLSFIIINQHYPTKKYIKFIHRYTELVTAESILISILVILRWSKILILRHYLVSAIGDY